MPPTPAQSPDQKVHEFERYFTQSAFAQKDIDLLISLVRNFKRGVVTIYWNGEPRKNIDTSKTGNAGELATLLMQEIDAFLISGLTAEEYNKNIEPTFTFTDGIIQ